MLVGERDRGPAGRLRASLPDGDLLGRVERVGIASRVLFSRVTIQLAEADVIETERVPIDIGKPRNRL
ncbi:Uncharacterized protein AArcCO_0736 [Halalkaliarchaeum sp. AArc-CO]|uniref:transcriptional regulator TbsP domain-containing protein n=1 Tax=unclassified Halalkaliarchaeum TaxID=2678344 RepID=UPI00217CDD0D|nr:MULTISPECIES: DUF5821 family protein [unclassified Halalkaliarchaeum]MDR5672321.1 DUF5821 family protein [Halalkaliarchaeum sp. AArc-GB]UWG50057.1 Uncharacterized protein AArcCO_0736 [Halalkaliarchaeum sp. AArc-CO]